MTNPTHRKISTGEPVFPGGEDPADLELLPDGFYEASELSRLKAEGRNRIDETAGAFRSTFLTSIPGQESVYAAKAAEAAKWLQIGSNAVPDRTAFPYLFAEAFACSGVATFETITARATLIMAAAAQVGAANPILEGARVARKEAITSATEAEEVEALASVDWGALLQS